MVINNLSTQAKKNQAPKVQTQPNLNSMWVSESKPKTNSNLNKPNPIKLLVGFGHEGSSSSDFVIAQDKQASLTLRFMCPSKPAYGPSPTPDI